MQTRARNDVGMSLVELMIVVVIIGILAAISVISYRGYIKHARKSEAVAMLAEFSSKEQLYFLEAGQYMEAHNGSVNFPSVNENAAEFWPQNPDVTWDSTRFPVAVNPVPASWRRLGIRPRWNQLFCTYMVNAGPAGAALPGFVGPTQWGGVPPNVPWFYAFALCNFRGAAGWDSNLGKENIFIVTHDSPALQEIEERQ
jgi:prepilin-type N-terminal cleavage/methylation domain-containing protein